MSMNKLIRASLLGLAILVSYTPQLAAQGLSVMRGTTSSNISVAVNRAIVVQSDRPFAEISVANPAIADIATLSESTIYVLGKVPGRTTLTIFGVEGELVANVDVRVVPDIAEFKERLAEILPGEPIEVRTANDGIVLSGRVSGARKVSRALELAERYAPGRVTNLMMVGGTQQVMLQVRFAEMQRSVSKSLSSSVGLTDFVNGVVGNGVLVQGNNMVNIGTGGPYTSSNDRTGAALFSFGGGGFAVDLLIEALETKGMVRTLAEPNIVAISGETAEFHAGGEYPVVTVTELNGTDVEFKPFGVSLDFTPFVIDDNLIRLELETTVSSIDRAIVGGSADFPIFGFKTRTANTTVEMRDGQSFAIAGLLQDDFDDTVGQVPWLGDVPILGTLFRSTDFQRKQSELVVIITPHLVVPTTADALSMATNHMRIPTEEELFLLGTTEGSASAQDIQGSYGYVME